MTVSTKYVTLFYLHEHRKDPKFYEMARNNAYLNAVKDFALEGNIGEPELVRWNADEQGVTLTHRIEVERDS